MREPLLELLCCPACKKALQLHAGKAAGAHIITGSLTCAACGASYQIIEGVPDFVIETGKREVEQTTSGFAANWRRYSDVIMAQPALNDELFRDWIVPMEPESLQGKVVLDAGCGMGRWLAAAAPHADQDAGGLRLLGDRARGLREHAAPEARARGARRHLRLPFVPMKPKNGVAQTEPAFDACYSIGVVHHTPDPEGAFAALLDVVKEDGALAVWVYGKENNEWIENIVSPVRKLITSRMPDAALYALTKVLTLQLAAAAHGYARAFPTPTSFAYDAYARHLFESPRPYLEHIVYDHLVPQLAQYLPKGDVERWATSAAPRVLAHLTQRQLVAPHRRQERARARGVAGHLTHAGARLMTSSANRRITILVTGGTGFIGRHTVDALVRAAGHRVRCLCRGDEPALRAAGAEVVRGDVLLKDSVAKALDGVDMVIGAGLVSRSSEDASLMMKLHVNGTRHVVGLACERGVKRVVHLSTSGTVACGSNPDMVYREDDPIPFEQLSRFPYYLSKWLAERVAEDCLRTTTSRTSSSRSTRRLPSGPATRAAAPPLT